MPPQRSIRPPVDLPAPEELLESIRWRFRILEDEGDSHPLFKMSPAKWQDKCDEKLAEAMGAGPTADKALIELCGLDPRYLATELVIAKILDWKLRGIFGNIKLARTASEPPLKTPAEVRARKAAAEKKRLSGERVTLDRKKLNRLGDAIAAVSGKGLKGYKLRRQIRDSFHFHFAMFENIHRHLEIERTHTRVGVLAETYDLDKKFVLRIADASRLEGLVDEYLAPQFSVSTGRFRGLRTIGNAKT